VAKDFDIPDDNRDVNVEIEVLDDDPFDWWIFKDDRCDISRRPTNGDAGSDPKSSENGRNCKLTYDLKTGIWSGDDHVGDNDGYGHSSGEENTLRKTIDTEAMDILGEIIGDLNIDFSKTHVKEIKGRTLQIAKDKKVKRLSIHPSRNTMIKQMATFKTVMGKTNLLLLTTPIIKKITDDHIKKVGDCLRFNISRAFVIENNNVVDHRIVVAFTTDLDGKKIIKEKHFVKIDNMDLGWFGMVIVLDEGSLHEDDCEIWFDIRQNDYDGDNMPYMWEIAYGLDPTVNDGSLDKDNDGATNYQEWKIGKDPTRRDIKGFHLTVSFNWDVNSDYMNDFVEGMKLASNYLFDVTDGYMFISKMSFYDNSVNWRNADVQVYVSDKWPMADVGGIKNSNRYIYLPHNWDGHGYPWDYSWKNPNAYRTFIHEIGHYALFLYDEYIDADGDEYPRDSNGIPQGPLVL